MRYLPDAKQMKTADSFTINELKIPSLELMERAARACVDHIKDWKIKIKYVSSVVLEIMAGTALRLPECLHGKGVT